MREIAAIALRELDLDYLVTYVSGGASRNYEIVMWDKPHNTYFSIRLTRDPTASPEALIDQIKHQLRERLDCFARGRNQFAERAPTVSRSACHRPAVMPQKPITPPSR